MLDRRQALVTFGAGAFGILAAGVPDLIGRASSESSDHGRDRAGGSNPTPTPTRTRRDPGYAEGVRAIDPQKMVTRLTDLTPAPPPNAIALTLDDGPHPTYTPMMLDLLAEFKVKATFSMIGTQVTEFPRLVNRVADAGHQISNHTVTHPTAPLLPRLATARIEREISGCYDRIAQTTGTAPKFFRSPGGAYSPAVLEIAATHGMTSLYWVEDPRDWDQPRSSVAHIVQELSVAKPGDILLSHDGGGNRTRTLAALRTVIPALQAKGYSFVAL